MATYIETVHSREAWIGMNEAGKRSSGSRLWTGGVAAIALFAAVLGGCGKSEPNTGADGASASSKQGESGKSGEPMEITWMVRTNTGTLPDNSYAQKYIEDNFNVKLKVTSIGYDDYQQKQKILLSSGTVPDVFYAASPADLKKFQSMGILAEVPKETIQQSAPGIFAGINKYAASSWYIPNVNGKNYGLPTYYYSGQFASRAVWRTDLLQKAGIAKIPDTLEELEAAFAALKKIGVTGMTSRGNSEFAAFLQIFGAYGIMPTQWMLKDGKVVNGATQPEAKQALTLLADWYKKGYIDPEFVTGKDTQQKVLDGKVAMFDYVGADTFPSWVDALKKANPSATLEMAPPPKGPGGRSTWAWGLTGNSWVFGKQLEKQPEKLKKILQIFDTLQNDESKYVGMFWGVKGTHWDYIDPAKGVAGGLKYLPPYTDSNERDKLGLDSSYANLFVQQPNPAIADKYYDQELLKVQKQGNYPQTGMFGKADAVPDAGKYWSDLIKLKVETYAKIVSGMQPVSSFDDFVKQWNDLGGTALEKNANELYQQLKIDNK
ncbi:extracellular solute-binding protein [Paenibacillus ginsengarvi]|uniref:Extracellular solute-binding protein n=2 Tax=Paenibacillus ginsengarvi TaxID=400777 RepID=A0A3B0BXL3_9BACL|nr:extracellular solute-binding protein [Paenibacillus ginsengarvi]